MKIEIWSDVVCPWCYIGKRRLERALRDFDQADDVEITWRSFQLNPDFPPGTAVPTPEYLASRFGPQAEEMTGRVALLGAGEGLDLRFADSLAVNTFDAHRVLHLAAAAGRAGEVKERLLRAHFTEGADLSDPETLARLAGEAGVPPDRVRAMLAGDAYADAVRADIDEARALGANGVPFFVIDRKYGISGAQSAEVFLRVLQQAQAEAG
ncbi:MAG: DsbA family oxidoreductase [Streptosporangiaceae bacterium]